MNYQCIYFLDKVAFRTPKQRDRALEMLPRQLKVMAVLIGNSKVDKFIVDNPIDDEYIYLGIRRQAILDAEIKKDNYWVCVVGTDIPQFNTHKT